MTTDKPSAGELASRETLPKLLREEAAREDHRGAGLILRQAADEIERLRSPPVAGAEVGIISKDIAKLMDKYGVRPPPPPKFWIDLEQMLAAVVPLTPPVAERGGGE